MTARLAAQICPRCKTTIGVTKLALSEQPGVWNIKGIKNAFINEKNIHLIVKKYEAHSEIY